MKKIFNISMLLAMILLAACSKSSNNTPEPDPEKPGVGRPVIEEFSPASAEIKTDIKITGKNFGLDKANLTINIGGKAVEIEIVSLSDTQIVFRLLKPAGSGQITVTKLKENVSVTSRETFTYMSDYVVKTVGISRILIAVDNNYKLTQAMLYGGGNKITLAAGKGYTAEVLYSGISTMPDELSSGPDGVMRHYEDNIDNGKMPDTSGGAAVIRLKGFDRKKTGYNQLNLVMCKYSWDINRDVGYFNNIEFTHFRRASGKHNSDYSSNAFVTDIFSGGITVTSVELAPPVSQKTYIIEDQIIHSGQSVYNPTDKFTYKVDLSSYYFRCLLNYTKGSTTKPIAENLTGEWVNADNGAILSDGDRYVYRIRFNNMIPAKQGFVVLPSDTATKVFYRVKGFDRNVYGFDQLRLFIADDPYFKGEVQVIYNKLPGSKPTFEQIKQIYTVGNAFGLQASPIWRHY